MKLKKARIKFDFRRQFYASTYPLISYLLQVDASIGNSVISSSSSSSSSSISVDFYVYGGTLLQIDNQMNSSNDKLLYYAACEGDIKKVKELLSKGAGTRFRDGVSVNYPFTAAVKDN